MDIKSGTAEVNNTKLYYEEAGMGCPVILIHGEAHDLRMWDGQFEPFACNYRMVRVDLRGFGKSALPDEKPFNHVDDIAALMDYLNIESAHLIGQSAGSEIACDFAAEYTERAHGLVLLDPLLYSPSSEQLSKITATALILVGEYDTQRHSTAEELRTAIPRNGKITLPFVGELSNMQEPEMFNDVVLEFLASISCGCAGG